MTTYAEFLEKKLHFSGDSGFEPTFMPDCLMGFQRHLVEWSIRQGRSAIFADCGLGKTLMQLVWAANVAEHTGRPVLILTPLAVADQTVREAVKFGLPAERSKDGTFSGMVVVANYSRLHYFDCNKFAGAVCDESSILKNEDGATRAAVTEFMRRMEYRLLCTATAAPNDYIELGTSSEALGHLGYMDMLGMFFKNDQNSLHPSSRGRFNDAWYGAKWRFKPHAESHFWRWMCSWSRAVRKPSDLGFDDGPFVLPKLTEQSTIVKASRPMGGRLFVTPAVGLKEQRQERRHTIDERCRAVAEKCETGEPVVVWCHLNDESALLEKLIPGAVQVSGTDSDDEKERKFAGFSDGSVRVLVTKPKIGALGLNWQHCRHMTFFPSHSFEQYYQAVRRCWRFGQTQPVTVDIVTTEGESEVMINVQRKAAAAEKMFEMLVQEMNNQFVLNSDNRFTKGEKIPSWL